MAKEQEVITLCEMKLEGGGSHWTYVRGKDKYRQRVSPTFHTEESANNFLSRGNPLMTDAEWKLFSKSQDRIARIQAARLAAKNNRN